MTILRVVRGVATFGVGLVLTLWVMDMLGELPWYIYLPAGLGTFLAVEAVFSRVGRRSAEGEKG